VDVLLANLIRDHMNSAQNGPAEPPAK